MNTAARYNQALDYLYSFVDYSLKHSSELAKADFNLGRMRQLMAELGNPQDAYPTIHVAGTKGKGSVSALCAAALQAAGQRTGLYTSPHLLDYAERLQVDGRPIPHTQLADLVDEIKPAVARIDKLTTFEITTALGFLYFARARVDAAVIEVGLGGRLDATNVITPRVSVITSLSYDHTAVLGETLTLIAGEKAGIIKPGVPVVSSPQKEEALRVLETIAAERGCTLTLIGRELVARPIRQSLDGQTFELAPIDGSSYQLSMPLLGAHQLDNAATAYAALKASGLDVPDTAIRQGFAKVNWPARFEIASRADPTVVFDSAHNEDSFERLTETLQAYFPGRRVTLVCGVSEDKHLAAMLSAIQPLLARVIATRADHPRALAPEQIVAAAGRLGLACEAVMPVRAALKRALENAQKDGSIVLSAGSIFVTAEAKSIYQRTSSGKQTKNG